MSENTKNYVCVCEACMCASTHLNERKSVCTTPPASASRISRSNSNHCPSRTVKSAPTYMLTGLGGAASRRRRRRRRRRGVGAAEKPATFTAASCDGVDVFAFLLEKRRRWGDSRRGRRHGVFPVRHAVRGAGGVTAQPIPAAAGVPSLCLSPAPCGR